MRVLVCGDRYWKSRASIARALKELIKEHGLTAESMVIIEGECIGADIIAKEIALKNDIQVLPFPADFNGLGKKAGPIRNQRMLDEGKPDIVLAFHSNIEQSRGTKDMIARAKKAGLEVRLYSE